MGWPSANNHRIRIVRKRAEMAAINSSFRLKDQFGGSALMISNEHEKVY